MDRSVHPSKNQPIYPEILPLVSTVRLALALQTTSLHRQCSILLFLNTYILHPIIGHYANRTGRWVWSPSVRNIQTAGGLALRIGWVGETKQCQLIVLYVYLLCLVL